ncbi:hypothetical protein DV515_00001319, partial [Chloebia gouldiae]
MLLDRCLENEQDKPVEEALLERYGFPEAGTETRCYTNHALSYDQAKRRAMAETFYLSNIVPQNYENNAGFWNRWCLYFSAMRQPEELDCLEAKLVILDKTKDVKNICEVDTCKLMGFKEFTLYIAARKVQSARTLRRLEKAMAELQEAGIEPDEYLLKLYKKKEEELLQEKP